MSTPELVIQQVRRQLAATNGALVLGLDNDQPGQEATPKLVEGLAPLGLKSTAVRVAMWPGRDVNAWLQAGGTPEQAAALLARAETWLERLVAQATPEEDEEPDEDALREVFAALAGLDVYEIARWRPRLCDALKLRKSTFDALLKAARQEAGLADDGKPQYQVLGGRLTHRYYDRIGNEVYDPLCNFSARIVSELLVDDGDVQERRFCIEGALAAGEKLSRIEVLAEDFSGMGWVLGKWGARAVVNAGGSTKDHLRAAIQAVSHEVATKYVYGHLGWLQRDEQWLYLTADGAVGHDAVQVEMSHDLLRYKLPSKPSTADILTGMTASLRMLEAGDYAATIPIWAAMYAAPLSKIVPPSFTVWMFGTTGSLKSSLTALAMNHFGPFSYNTPPASWTGTASALEKKAFLVADARLLIDDYVQQCTIAGTNELKAKVDQLLRDWGNRAGRSRMQANLKLRQTYAPRGLIVSTAEQLPPGESIQARLFQVEVHPGMLVYQDGSPLKTAWGNDAALYPAAMAGYVQWIAAKWDELAEQLPGRLLDYTDAARQEAGHLRMPTNVGHLFMAWECALQYAQEIGAIDAARYETLRELGWRTLLAVGQAQVVEANEEKPVDLFLRAIEEMLAQGTIWLKHAQYPDIAEKALPKPADRAPNTEFLGWHDEVYWYLLPGPIFKTVVQYYRAQGIVFPDTSRGIKTKLKEQKRLHPTESNPWQYQMSEAASPQKARVWRVLIPNHDAPSTE